MWDWETGHIETLEMVVEHWANYYFPEVNDKTNWLKLVSEGKKEHTHTNKCNSKLFYKCKKILFS